MSGINGYRPPLVTLLCVRSKRGRLEIPTRRQTFTKRGEGYEEMSRRPGFSCAMCTTRGCRIERCTDARLNLAAALIQ